MSHSADSTYDVYEETIRKARKEYRCDACKLPIRPGDHYAYVAIVFEREFESVRRCGACQTTHLHLRELCAGGDMWPNERLSCGIKYEDEWEDEPPEAIAALPFLSDDERGRLLTKPAKAFDGEVL